jgi:Amt family ammonium transporter
LDTFGVHAVGGTLGAFLTGVLATAEVNANLSTNLKDIVGKTLWFEQLKAISITMCLAILGTLFVAYVVKALVGLRVSEDVETAGLDVSEHGEEGYHCSVGGSIVAQETPAGESILAAVDTAIGATAKKKGPQPI